MTDHAFGCVPSIAIMSGFMTSFIAGPMMVKSFEKLETKATLDLIKRVKFS